MIRETLIKAKAVLEERGWDQDWVENDYLNVNDPEAGCVCLATAVAIACGYNSWPSGVQGFLERDYDALSTLAALALEARVSCPGSETVLAVTAWNDGKGRTKEQVFELIDRTTERVEG